ncbi:MAG: glycosyltransferase family 4 protein [Candidatus Hodarchaeota archaeon]
MKVAMITCWFHNQVYGYYTDSLKSAIEDKIDGNVKIISSNCSCFTQSSGSLFKLKWNDLINQEAHFARLPYLGDWPSKSRWKLYLRNTLRYPFEMSRGVLFLRASAGYHVVHFHQFLFSFGAPSAWSLLLLPSSKKRFITIHEIDPIQNKHKSLNKIYNRASAVIAHFHEIKRKLVELGVSEDKIKVVPYGTTISPLKGSKRAGAVFYGGHHLLIGKGFDDLLNALGHLKEAGKKIKVTIHGEFTGEDLRKGKTLAEGFGVGDYLEWPDRPIGQSVTDLYQRSLFCVIPFTKGSACYPVTTAMANGTPVIATKRAGTQEYLGDLGIYIDIHSPVQLAERMADLMDNPAISAEYGPRMREKAIRFYSWDAVANKTLELYRDSQQ